MSGGIFIGQEVRDVAILAANRELASEIGESILDFVTTCSREEVIGVLRTEIPTIKTFWQKPSDQYGEHDYCPNELYEPMVKMAVKVANLSPEQWELRFHRFSDGRGWHVAVMNVSGDPRSYGEFCYDQHWSGGVRQMVFLALKRALTETLDGFVAWSKERGQEVEAELGRVQKI